MDAVYIVGPWPDNEQLRYSLRSLDKNMPFVDKVWVAGFCPTWVTNVGKIPLEPVPDKFANQRQSLRAACEDNRISPDFVLMNDDMFALMELPMLPVWHLGKLSTLIRRLNKRGLTDKDQWFFGLKQTLLQMREWGYANPNAYEAHIPLQFNRDELAVLLDKATREPFLWGAAYNATSGKVGKSGENVKVADMGSRELLMGMRYGQPFLSTEDPAFEHGIVGTFVRNLFPDPCQYEEVV